MQPYQPHRSINVVSSTLVYDDLSAGPSVIAGFRTAIFKSAHEDYAGPSYQPGGFTVAFGQVLPITFSHLVLVHWKVTLHLPLKPHGLDTVLVCLQTRVILLGRETVLKDLRILEDVMTLIILVDPQEIEAVEPLETLVVETVVEVEGVVL